MEVEEVEECVLVQNLEFIFGLVLVGLIFVLEINVFNYFFFVEYVEVFQELQWLESCFQFFLQCYYEVLGVVVIMDYNNNYEGWEEDQWLINLVGESL